MENFELLEQIGEGEYGQVFKAQHKLTKKFFALKQIKLENEREGVPSTTIREIALLKDLDHPNIIKLFNIVHHSKRLFLVLEICSCDLKRFMSESKSAIKLFDAKAIVYQLLMGLDALDQSSIMHRDLKPQNILILRASESKVDGKAVEFPVAKIGDFGLARSCSIPVQNYTSEVVTRWYRAPELLLNHQRYNESIEMWSMGCILVEILTKKALFPGSDEKDQLRRIFSLLGSPKVDDWPEIRTYEGYSTIKNWEELPKQDLYDVFLDVDESAIDLIEKMLRLNPKRRISIPDALRHKWFDEVRDAVSVLYD